MNSYLQQWLAFLLVLFSSGCSDSVQHLTKTSVSTPAEHALIALLNDSTRVSDETLYSRCQLDDFYSLRGHKLLWHKGAVMTPQADSMVDIIHKLDYSGLIPEDYHLDSIDELAFHIRNNKADALSIANLDVFLTDALFTVASHLRFGRMKMDTLGWSEAEVVTDSVVMNTITRAISRNELSRGLHELEPRYSAYHTLKRVLGWKLDSLRSPLVQADKKLLEKQAVDLSMSMEQWRWERHDIDSRYIFINIPAFRLALVNHDSLEFESRVIVGTPYYQTPVLDGRISNFIVYPSWNVPRSIATLELLPKIKRDSSYLASNNYRILNMKGNEIHPDSVDWSRQGVNHFPYMIQQVPGDFNALGLLKFNFVNPYNIYLHDTNAKRLFDVNYRALSHGCVRVEHALGLARHLVHDENPYCSPRDFDRFMRAELSRQVSLKPIDLRIRYITCEAQSNGSVLFHNDIYGRNAKLAEAIYCRQSRKLSASALAKNLIQQPGQPDACL